MNGAVNEKKIVDFFYARTIMKHTKAIYGEKVEIFNVKSRNAYSY
jgi:hypothetical protein